MLSWRLLPMLPAVVLSVHDRIDVRRVVADEHLRDKHILGEASQVGRYAQLAGELAILGRAERENVRADHCNKLKMKP